jgi:predicted nucleotidyltransferase
MTILLCELIIGCTRIDEDVAWDDRRFERDGQDLGLIMRHYLHAGNQDRIYSEQGDWYLTDCNCSVGR